MTQSILSLAQTDALAECRGPGLVSRLVVLPLVVLSLVAIVPTSFTATDVIALPPQQ